MTIEAMVSALLILVSFPGFQSRSDGAHGQGDGLLDLNVFPGLGVGQHFLRSDAIDAGGSDDVGRKSQVGRVHPFEKNLSFHIRRLRL
ncbi:hypothetical protein [Thalassovita aquimarina]|uniref:Secreted protein n=1 Tax=Thalassovita aquimarina TaxID=2785917 RepID=A0ABS5HTS2_9RHOB|nr:hypothetical protein [Thalassovita aquimarina]MBR9651943.1 hypothetical protein [Thalassovita aquimarina]